MPRGRPGVPSPLRGRSYEEIYGVEKALELRSMRMWSSESRAAVDQKAKGLKISVALRGRSKSLEHRAAQSAAMKGKNTRSTEQRREDVRKHNAKNLPGCRCYVHGAARPYMISSYTWLLAEALVALGFEVVIPEQQFGYCRVDCLLGDEWLAIEADGSYHFTPERREYDARRDKKLMDQFQLSVVRLSGHEVKLLHAEVAKGGDAI